MICGCGAKPKLSSGIGPGGHYMEAEHCGIRAISYDGCGGQCDWTKEDQAHLFNELATEWAEKVRTGGA